MSADTHIHMIQEKFFGNQQKTLRSFIAIAAIGIVVFIAINFRILIISASSPATVYLNNSDNKAVKQLNVGKSSSISIVKNDTYNVSAVTEERQSFYEKKTSFLSLNKLTIDLKSQRNSAFIGSSNLGCSDSSTAPTVYYSCNPSTIAGVTTTQGILREDNDERNTSERLKPYGDNFLAAFIDQESIFLTLKSKSGQETKRTQVPIPNLRTFVDDRTFDTAMDTNNFAFFDSNETRIIRFKDVDDTKPEIINIDKESLDMEHYASRIIVGKTYTYLLNFNAEMHTHEGEEPSDHAQTLHVFKDGKLVKKHVLPADWYISKVSNSADDQIIISAIVTDKIQTFLINKDAKPKNIKLNTNNYQDGCWVNNDSFYYLSDEGKTIYDYSPAKKASHLVYDGLTGSTTITSLNCIHNNLTFTLNSETEGDPDMIKHYTLKDGDSTGVRPESVLPLYFNTDDTNTLEATMDASGIAVRLVYGTAPGKEAVKQKLYRELNNKGVTTKPNLLLNY